MHWWFWCSKILWFSNVLLQKTAELNCSHAYSRISDLYFLGNHFQKDYDKAISNYKSSTKLGNSTAYLLMMAEVIKKNIQKAIEYLIISAKKNNQEALYYMELIH